MSKLLVEDGTGLSNANSYVSVAELWALLVYLDKKAYDAEIARCQKTH